MSAFHPKQVSHTSNFSFSNLSLVDDNSSRKSNASILLNHQKSKDNHLGSNDKKTEDMGSDIDGKKASLGSRIHLNTAYLNSPNIPESRPSVPSVNSDNHSLVLSSTCKPELELQMFSDNQMNKVKTEVQTLSPPKTAGFTAAAGKPECVKQEPSNSSENDQTVLNAQQTDREVKSSVLNLAEPQPEICESFVSTGEQTPSLSVPGTELKTEEATKGVLTSEEIKFGGENASNNSSNNNEGCSNSKIKFDPTVGNDASSDQTKVKTSRSEAERYNKLLQLYIRKKRFAVSNSSGFADQGSDLQTSTTDVRRKIVFSSEEKRSPSKANKKIPIEKSNRLDDIRGNSGRINKFTSPSGWSGVQPRLSFEKTNFARKNKFERKILKAKRWGKGAWRAPKKTVVSPKSLPEKIYRNWGATSSSDKNSNLSIASYIRCRLSRLQRQAFRGRLEGTKLSTLANVCSGRKRRLSIDNDSGSQQAKRCRLTEDDDRESEETSILDFKKGCISKLDALEKEWNEKIDLEIEATNRDYKRDLRQQREQQSLENYTLCLEHSNQIYNGTMENMARKHWKEFRRMQNNFLLKTQNIEKKRHTRFAALRNEFKEAGEHIQTILDSTEMLSDNTDTQMLRNSPYKRRRISVDTAVMLVKEDKIYNSFYT